MIKLLEILSSLHEAPEIFPTDLTYVNVEKNDKMQTFNSIAEYEVYKEKFIQKLARANDLTPREAKSQVSQILVPLKKYIEQEIAGARVIPKKFWVSNTISDPKTMELFYYNMISWKQESDIAMANFLYKNVNTFKKGKSTNPEVFLPNVKPGTMMYRGLKSISPRTREFIRESNWEDWKRTEFKAGAREQDYWYSHEGFDYSPHMPAQSFTYDPKVIFSGEFYDSEDSVIIAKPLDEEFYFSNAFTEWLSYEELTEILKEKEAIRIGKEGEFKMLATRRTIASIKGQLRASDREKMMKRDNPNYDPSAPETAPQ